MSKVAQFPSSNGVPIVGQPFTLQKIMCPITATLSCNCGGTNTVVEITQSQPGTCPSCGRQFNLAFNPTTAGIECSIAVPKAEGEPS